MLQSGNIISGESFPLTPLKWLLEAAMKKALLLTALLLVVALPAFASGVNMAWGTDCYTTNPTTNASYVCNKNTGSNQMIISFAPSVTQPQFVGIEVYMEGLAQAVAVPDWWKMGSGECRPTAISADANFLTAPMVDCVDPWGNLQGGGLAAYTDGGNQMHIIIGYAIAEPVQLDANVEYYGCKVIITNAKTVGTGLCAGCTTPVIWGMHHLKSAELGPFEWLTEAIPGGNQCLTWQGSTLPCATPVPVKNSTWGQVKSLYR